MDGTEGNGVNIAANEKGKELGLKNNWKYSETGSAENLFAQLKQAGAKDIMRASKATLRSLQSSKLFSVKVPVEWLSDSAAPGCAWDGRAEDDYFYAYDAYAAYEYRGVRALRNVSSELGA